MIKYDQRRYSGVFNKLDRGATMRAHLECMVSLYIDPDTGSLAVGIEPPEGATVLDTDVVSFTLPQGTARAILQADLPNLQESEGDKDTNNAAPSANL